MKVIVVCAALVAAVLSSPAPKWRTALEQTDGADMEYFLVETSEGVYEIEDLVNAELSLTTSQSDLTYYFYSSSSPSTPTVVTSDTVSDLNGSFAPSKETLFTIHGWKNSKSSEVNTYIREAVLPKYDINLIVVDWNPIARRNYISAQASVVAVGNYIASFIRSLESTYGLVLSRVTLAGHSLGAHVAGNTGAALDGDVAVIVGLDPAGPLFTISNTANRLDPTDAEFVHVIHTNAGLIGNIASIGDADYRPNGGSHQHGCLDLTGSCSHDRSYVYYAESISSSTNGFIATQCDSYLHYTLGSCSSSETSPMGGYQVDTSASGNYYLTTNSVSPYAQG